MAWGVCGCREGPSIGVGGIDMGLWSRIRKSLRKVSNDEIDEELQFHIDMDVSNGRSVREAHLRLGNMTHIEEETRAAEIVEWLNSLLRDWRYGLRQLRKAPVVASVVVLSLTIGIGVNTAIFSLIDAAILSPLPVKNPDSLRIIEWTSRAFPDGV